jgi:hypothetical protein
MSLAKQLSGRVGDLLLSKKFTASVWPNDGNAPTH